MLVSEPNPSCLRQPNDRAVLLPAARLRLEQVGVIGIDAPGELQRGGFGCAIGENEDDVERVEAELVVSQEIQRTTRQPIGVARLLLLCTIAAAAGAAPELGVGIGKRQFVLPFPSSGTQPRGLPVHFEPQPAEISSLSKVEPGERAIRPATFAVPVRNNQRRAVPGVELTGTDANLPCGLAGLHGLLPLSPAR